VPFDHQVQIPLFPGDEARAAREACRRYCATKDDGNVTCLLTNNPQSVARSVLLPASCISLVAMMPPRSQSISAVSRQHHLGCEA